MQARFIVVAAILVFASALAAGAQGRRAADPGTRIEVRAQVIESFDPRDPGRTRFGGLSFRGGLVLGSPHKDFGGISSLIVAPDGARFLAASDKAHWLRGRIVYRGARPVGIADAEMAPMLGPDGRPFARRGWYDTEALAQDGNTIYAALERVHEIVRFDYGSRGLSARAQPIAVPPAMKKLPSNKGVECLAMPRPDMPLAGTLIAISERALDTAGNILGFLIGGAQSGTFTVKRTDEFEISDCAITPRGELLLLERRFSWARGVAMRMRRVPLTRIAPGAVLDGPELIFADMGYQVDNMEGLSLHTASDGTLVLTMISDDNFSIIQRTLLLQFGWTE